MWICPHCQEVLVLTGSQWQCANNHSYDKAKAGYVNLLLANQKSRPDPGDNKAMISARRAFLEGDYYQPLVQALVELIQQHTSASPLAIYDAGCGEGYYLGRIVAQLHKNGRSMRAAGSDISRPAVEKAAKKYQDIAFAIASNYRMPVADASQTLVLLVFAPASADEVLRVLETGGLWLRVSPGAEHLAQLKAMLYQSPQPHAQEDIIPAGFELISESRVSFDLTLADSQSRKELLMMTPYYWRVEQGAMDSVLEKMAEVRADFAIRLLSKS